ncbi:hypothetical protein QAD02_024141 [Eretmocerus hayati]|uniref:Uncharacterized protein n=1 Tax=Eretmocerus hayati TaxID=131215 RepID=A0ACC2Q022_9HYME|nr:hypothetical protein QAD02_024141 [Eretmocerus hayati]
MDEEVSDSERKNYVSCLTWVKRGVAASIPDKIELTPQELKAIIQSTHSELQEVKDDADQDSDAEDDPSQSQNCMDLKDGDDVDVDNQENTKAPNSSKNSADEFNFEKYDDESGSMYCNLDGIAEFGDGKDPLITVRESEDEDSEKEDDLIKPDDNLVLVGHIVDDASILEVYVYNEKEGSFYCHHHDYLSFIPLCFEWLSFDPSAEKPGNLCAIGNDTPIIEVWDLDVVGGVGPVFKLGSKPNKKKHTKRVGHKDAVLDLAWNSNYGHILASASADRTTLLWDLDSGTPSTKFSCFQGIVQSIQWHCTETHLLLTGSMDKKVRLLDCKTEDVKTWEASGEVERVLWNKFDPNICFISTDNGFIECIDIRNEKALWQKQIQEDEIAGLSMSTSCPGLLVSSDKSGIIRIWDISNLNEPRVVLEKQTNLGHIICLEASCDSPFAFAIGGDNKAHNLNVLDLSTYPEVSERFRSRAPNVASDDSIQMQSHGSKHQELMDVTEDLGSIALGSDKAHKVGKKKKKPRHRNMK